MKVFSIIKIILIVLILFIYIKSTNRENFSIAGKNWTASSPGRPKNQYTIDGIVKDENNNFQVKSTRVADVEGRRGCEVDWICKRDANGRYDCKSTNFQPAEYVSGTDNSNKCKIPLGTAISGRFYTSETSLPEITDAPAAPAEPNQEGVIQSYGYCNIGGVSNIKTSVFDGETGTFTVKPRTTIENDYLDARTHCTDYNFASDTFETYTSGTEIINNRWCDGKDILCNTLRGQEICIKAGPNDEQPKWPIDTSKLDNIPGITAGTEGDAVPNDASGVFRYKSLDHAIVDCQKINGDSTYNSIKCNAITQKNTGTPEEPVYIYKLKTETSGGQGDSDYYKCIKNKSRPLAEFYLQNRRTGPDAAQKGEKCTEEIAGSVYEIKTFNEHVNDCNTANNCGGLTCAQGSNGAQNWEPMTKNSIAKCKMFSGFKADVNPTSNTEEFRCYGKPGT